MYRIMIAVLLAFSMIVPTFAQDADEEEQKSPFTDIKLKTRVQVITKKGSVFRGLVFFVNDVKLILDVSMESTELDGRIGFQADNVRRVIRLRSLTAEEQEAILKEKDRVRKELDAELAALREKREALEAEREAATGESKDSGEPKSKSELEEEEREKALKLVEQFPPKDGWDADRYDWLKRKYVVTGVALTEKEQTFVDNYETWKKGVKFLEDQASKQQDDEKKATEEEDDKKKTSPPKKKIDSSPKSSDSDDDATDRPARPNIDPSKGGPVEVPGRR
jgi:hypothetical protein